MERPHSWLEWQSAKRPGKPGVCGKYQFLRVPELICCEVFVVDRIRVLIATLPLLIHSSLSRRQRLFFHGCL
jgi:hypothetical protein